MKNVWLKLTCLGLALVMLLTVASACSLFGETTGAATSPATSIAPTSSAAVTEVPVVAVSRAAPNNLDLAGTTEAALATPGEGAILVNEAARVWVPPGSVAQDTPVTLKTFIESPGDLTSTDAGAAPVSIISNIYDLGPDNTAFTAPVTVTLSYDEADLPAGADENNIRPAYYDGADWITLDRQLDTENDRASFAVTSFPGMPLLLVVGYAVTGTAITAAAGAITYKTYTWWVKDPLYYGKAASYVTPNDPTVQAWGERMQVSLTNANPPHPINVNEMMSDPAVLKDFADAGGGFIQFADPTNPLGSVKPVYEKAWFPNDWQMPADYFTNGMVGDCKNVANAMASIFRNYGYQARCVDGYMVNDEGQTRRHGWLEVVIDGKLYYVGSHAEIMPLDNAVKQYTLTRPVGKDGEGYEWDETGQVIYKKNWWVDKIEVSVDKTMAFPGGQVGVTVIAPAGKALDITLTLELDNATVGTYGGTTDAATGKVTIPVTLQPDAKPGVYFARASVADGTASDVGIFSVEILELTAGVTAPQVAPGEDIGINVQFNYPVAAKIIIDGVNGGWFTDPDGSKTISLNVPDNAKLGPYTLTVRAPEYKLAKTVTYTVTVPPTLKVEIKNKEVAPGGSLEVNITVLPPQVTAITISGYSQRWNTDADGLVTIKFTVPAATKPGQYTITAEAPQLQLTESDTYTVTLTPAGPVITLGDITVIAGQVTINAEGEDEDSYFGMELMLGGQYVRKSGVNGNEIIASGTVDAGEMYYSFTLNNDLTTITSGTISLVADTGEYYEVRFTNVPNNADDEAKFYTDNGMDAFVFHVTGTAVWSHISSINVNEPSLGTFNKYYAGDESEIIVILAVATAVQATQMVEN